MIATAPGKLILSGEYAVLDGAPAVVVAIDRRAIARRTRSGDLGDSPFLLAVVEELARQRGDDDPAVGTARAIEVDSGAFYDGGSKLGLGSSAAVTVAATALALTTAHGEFDRDEVLKIALPAHGRAQARRHAERTHDARPAVTGSGADVAAAVYGGTLVYEMGPRLQPRRWPDTVQLMPFFTGASADTATLVARVGEARTRHPGEVEAALLKIATASRAIAAALPAFDDPTDPAAAPVIAAFDRGRLAIDELARATGIELVPRCVTAVAHALSALGGTAKTTGAGGGDVGIAVIPGTTDPAAVTAALLDLGCQPLRFRVADTGVDTRPDPQ